MVRCRDQKLLLPSSAQNSSTVSSTDSLSTVTDSVPPGRNFGEDPHTSFDLFFAAGTEMLESEPTSAVSSTAAAIWQ